MTEEGTLFDGKEKEVALTAEVVKAVAEEDKIAQEEGLVALAKSEAMTAATIGEVVAAAKAQVDIRKGVMQVVISATSPHDWVDQNGKPYLQASGCEKIAPFFNAGVKDITYSIETGKDEKGEWYRYIYIGTAYIKNRGQIVHEMPNVIGTCSSRDKFFGRANGKEKSIIEVDKSNIQKKARTNLYVNGVSRILGLRNLTWDELRAAGLKQEGSARVNYGGQGNQTAEDKSIKDKLADVLNKIISLRGFTPDVETNRLALKEFSQYEKDGQQVFAQKIENLTEPWAKTTYGRAKKALEELEAKATGGGK